jgi:hypothetical protein
MMARTLFLASMVVMVAMAQTDMEEWEEQSFVHGVRSKSRFLCGL